MPVGHTNNPAGRPPGRVNKRTQAVLDLIHERGDTDPLVALSDIVTKNQDPSIVAQAANILAPYVHSKRGTIPAPRFVEEPIKVPQFVSIQEAQNFLADIARRSGAGELELQAALDISTLVKNWILSVTAQQDYELKLQAQGGGDATIHITGGLPPLPGTSINMTNELSLDHNGHAIDHMPTETVQAEIPVHGSVEPPKDDSSQGPSEGPE